MLKIAFVCHGNICRSPMAEFVFKKIIKDLNLEGKYSAVSRATSDEEILWGVGNPMHRGTVGELKKNNIPFDESKRAVRLKKSDYGEFDLFLGMDGANIRNMHKIFGSDTDGKIKLLLDYTNKAGEYVADPWYTGDFKTTYEDIEKGILGFLRAQGDIK